MATVKRGAAAATLTEPYTEGLGVIAQVLSANRMRLALVMLLITMAATLYAVPTTTNCAERVYGTNIEVAVLIHLEKRETDGTYTEVANSTGGTLTAQLDNGGDLECIHSNHWVKHVVRPMAIAVGTIFGVSALYMIIMAILRFDSSTGMMRQVINIVTIGAVGMVCCLQCAGFYNLSVTLHRPTETDNEIIDEHYRHAGRSWLYVISLSSIILGGTTTICYLLQLIYTIIRRQKHLNAIAGSGNYGFVDPLITIGNSVTGRFQTTPVEHHKLRASEQRSMMYGRWELLVYSSIFVMLGICGLAGAHVMTVDLGLDDWPVAVDTYQGFLINGLLNNTVALTDGGYYRWRNGGQVPLYAVLRHARGFSHAAIAMGVLFGICLIFEGVLSTVLWRTPGVSPANQPDHLVTSSDGWLPVAAVSFLATCMATIAPIMLSMASIVWYIHSGQTHAVATGHYMTAAAVLGAFATWLYSGLAFQGALTPLTVSPNINTEKTTKTV